MGNDDFDRAIAAHDAAVVESGCVIWVGSEPTFTDRFSESAQWLHDALGDDKEQRAVALVKQLSGHPGGAVVLRTLGRQYPGEQMPRWSYGIYAHRDGGDIWNGPPDPLMCAEYLDIKGVDSTGLSDFRQQLMHELSLIGWSVAGFDTEHDNFNLRVIAHSENQPCVCDPAIEPRLNRASIHSGPVPEEGIKDELAAAGQLLFLVGNHHERCGEESMRLAWVELPAFNDSRTFRLILTALGRAANEVGLDHLILCGFPPPVDETVSWTTVTPDPAVVEINMAPYADVVTYLTQMRELFGVAREQNLSPRRIYYNGTVVDSGGGGHITLGGPTPERSPFILEPQLLPRLIAYFNRHPCLSYFFATHNVGSSGQSPRPDEGLPDSLGELQLALETLVRQQVDDADQVWQTLAPFLTDHTGNTHRSEINIEKLCNPYLPGRGRLGLAEFRAFRMAPTPEWSASVTALLRSITAMLSVADRPITPHCWGSELHDRFALPFYLQQDLVEVLADLGEAGLGLGDAIVERLMDDSRRLLGQTEIGGCLISVKSAIEFWPLVGNVAAQEGGSSRLVDSSSRRLEVTIRAVADQVDALADWQLSVDGHSLPLRLEQDECGAVLVFGLRYRSFYPQLGLHPGIAAQGPIRLQFHNSQISEAASITLYEWRPDNGAYDGLPHDSAEAQRRRAERFVVERVDAATAPLTTAPPEAALSRYCLDLRRF